jgi:hypothetical protein
LNWVPPIFCFVEDISYSIGANVELKITVFAFVFPIVDVMGSSQNNIFGDEHTTADLFLLQLVEGCDCDY